MPLRIIPVLDVKDGRAVLAIGGQRDHYGPVQSVLHASSDPISLSGTFRDRLGLTSLYLADLDAINGASLDLSLYRRILELGTDLWLDAGLRDETNVGPLLSLGVPTIIVGLETVRGPSALEAIIDRTGLERIAFSLDLREGQPVCSRDSGCWPDDPLALCRVVLSLGVRRLILLDVAHVGKGTGIGTLPLLDALSTERPNTEITVGGGISSVDDVYALSRTRASAVLIASALHNGRIGATELSRWDESSGSTHR